MLLVRLSDAERGKMKMKVPHRTSWQQRWAQGRDQIRFLGRSVPMIRIVLSMASLHKLKLATLDISKTYLQAGHLQRDIYMRPPTGFKSKPGELWKILKPAYGLVESGRLWQTTIEQWMIDTHALDIVPGLQQLFVYRSDKDHQGSSSQRLSMTSLSRNPPQRLATFGRPSLIVSK